MPKVVEKIREHCAILRGMAKNGIGTRWYIYLEMYDDYTRLCEEGHKQMYVIAYLCEIYRLSQSQLYRILGQLKGDWKE